MPEKLKILILDDDAVIRKVLSDILSDGFDVVATRNYSEFKAQIDVFRPDIIFLDLHLPDAYGIDICKGLRANKDYSNIYILIITASHNREVIEEGYAAGADDFIRKPFIPYEIQSKVAIFERIIRGREVLESAFRDQLVYNKKLYKLEEGIRNSLRSTGDDFILKSAEYLHDILDFNYIEMVKVDNERYATVLSQFYGDSSRFSTFSRLVKNVDINRITGSDHKYVVVKKDGYPVHAIISAIEQNKKVIYYFIIQSEQKFHQDDRKIIKLYIDYITVINDRINIEKILKTKNREYKSELSKIRKLQVSLLPDFGNIRGYDIAASYLPAQELSGDFFDGFYISENIYQLILCDISGHGMASAYVGTQIRTLFRQASEKYHSPADVAKAVNDGMIGDLSEMAYFGTVIICQIHMEEGRIIYLNAGHPSALFYTQSGEIKKLDQTGPLVGLFSDNTYKEKEIYIKERECLFLYTDGLIEAFPRGGPKSAEMYGEQRLIDNFSQSQELSSRNLIHSILGSVYEYIDFVDQEDDITAICIRKDSNVGNIIIF